MLTPEQKAAYIHHNGAMCPYCKKSNHIAPSSYEGDGGYAFQDRVCVHCRKEWIDVFKLHDIDEKDDD